MLLAIGTPQVSSICCTRGSNFLFTITPLHCAFRTNQRCRNFYIRTCPAEPQRGLVGAPAHKEPPCDSWSALLPTYSRLTALKGLFRILPSSRKHRRTSLKPEHVCRSSSSVYTTSPLCPVWPLGTVCNRSRRVHTVQLSSKWQGKGKRQQTAAAARRQGTSQTPVPAAPVYSNRQSRQASQRQPRRQPFVQQGTSRQTERSSQQLELAPLPGNDYEQQQQWQPPHLALYTRIRAAAAGSTDLLLTVLGSQLTFVTAADTAHHAGQTSGQALPQLTSQQRKAVLRGALVCISWHCHNHQLLPLEAQRLQNMLLLQLLPALAPHIAHTQKAVLARVVYALGSCAAAVWQPNAEVHDDSGREINNDHKMEHVNHQDSQDAALEAAELDQPEQEQLQPEQQQQEERLLFLQQQGHQGHLSSASWVQRLLALLDPQHLTPGSLLAAWKGAALHQVRPPDRWLHQASLAAYYALQRNKLDFNDVAALLQACAELDYAPPSWLMQHLVTTAQSQLPFFNPADLSGVLASLQQLSFRPSNTFLRVWCETSSRLLRAMTVGQLAAAAEALSWAGYNPQPWWARRFTAASLPLLPVATVEELLLLLDAALNLRLRPPVSWLHECYCHLRANKEQLTLSQVADAAHVLAQLQPLPFSFISHHRAWLAQWLQQQQPADVAVLSRSELLYTLYAAGKLGVRLSRKWVAVALRQLHDRLDGAEPAELVAVLVVFCHFKRQQYTEAVVPAVWIQDCLAAAVDCLQMFSYEGLLQLLLACKDMQHSQQDEQQGDEGKGTQTESSPANTGKMADQQDEVVGSQQQQQQAELQIQQSIGAIADAFLVRVSQMNVVQLARVCKALEAPAGSSRPEWYQQLVQQCKAALAEQG